MPKKKSSSLKKPSEEVEKKPAVEETKPVPKPGKLGIEIDEIFGGRKKKKPEVEEIAETKEEIAKKKRKMKRKRNEPGGFNNNNPQLTRPRKRTDDGLPIFTEDELRVNKPNAGDTPLCPFDCDCCF